MIVVPKMVTIRDTLTISANGNLIRHQRVFHVISAQVMRVLEKNITNPNMPTSTISALIAISKAGPKLNSGSSYSQFQTTEGPKKKLSKPHSRTIRVKEGPSTKKSSECSSTP
jgi:hypothetical protein